ncbi:haloacid dehalogenase [Brachybacterium endophyticum]|uniref:Haloacid dehalogenase n=1 Tax=Brachybacterium endophyticum TaxID=2182385 RepID=A0A2U2RJF5_9MICO|nr:HAD-IIA family hydrolase [Brachybacterium endophyticum]PWH05914.1 haloacid dehalogenase [Brachybacterium endophyticum]
MNARPTELSLLERYDALLLDLDGTLMHGSRPIPHAADAVRRARERSLSIGFVTNNASRSPEEAVAHLATVDVEARSEEIASSPQIAVQLLAEHAPAGSRILVLGADGLADAVRGAGFQPVREDAEDVAAVVQGFAPDLGWKQLAEGGYALRRGLPWIATNTDATLPTERGIAPGNGSLVHALVHATGRTPIVAGKPEPAMFSLAAKSLGARRPLAVGDRLDTDIEGGNRAGMDTLMVLTGVDDARTALQSPAVRRPTWIVADLSSLTAPAPDAVLQNGSARCGAATARLDGQDLVLSGRVDSPQALTAALALLRETHPDRPLEGEVRTETGAPLLAAPPLAP